MNKKAFTLVELLAVIAILALLVIIALPNIMSMFEEAKRKSFENEVKNIYMSDGNHQYISDHFVSLKNIEVSEEAYEDLEKIESCTRTPTETSVLDYTVSNGKVSNPHNDIPLIGS